MALPVKPRQIPGPGHLTAPAQGCLSQDRWAHGPRVIAQADSGGRLVVYLYADGAADAPSDRTLTGVGGTSTLSGTQVLETSGVTGCAVAVRPDGIADLLYCQASTTKHRQSRDGGQTWGVVATVALGSGKYVTQALDRRGRLVVCLCSDAGQWSVQVGTLNLTGAWQFDTAPVDVVAGAAVPGALACRADGVLELAYVATGGTAPTLIRCRNLETDGTGGWA